MKLLVTGGAGFIGSALVRKLIAEKLKKSSYGEYLSKIAGGYK